MAKKIPTQDLIDVRLVIMDNPTLQGFIRTEAEKNERTFKQQITYMLRRYFEAYGDEPSSRR